MNNLEFLLKAGAKCSAMMRFVFVAICLPLQSLPLNADSLHRSRLIVLADIGSDPDDIMSMVRLLLYSDEIDIEGSIAAMSCWKKTSVAPELIKRIMEAYGEVQPNLNKNSPGYPDANVVLQKIKSCIPKYGMEGVGEEKDSEGSDWIITVLEEDENRPLWISVWGSANTPAQALYKIEEAKTPAQVERLIAKLRVYIISDQDDSGIWIRKSLPSPLYIVSPGDDYGSATWSAINTVMDGINNEKISNAWLAEHIQQNHGALGAAYPDVAYRMEGDTPSWLNLIPNGLSDSERPGWGGWGGRYGLYKPDFSSPKKGPSGVPHEPESRKIWTDAVDDYTPNVPSEFGRTVKPGDKTFHDIKVTLWRWRDDSQNDFAARMEWCTKPY